MNANALVDSSNELCRHCNNTSTAQCRTIKKNSCSSCQRRPTIGQPPPLSDLVSPKNCRLSGILLFRFLARYVIYTSRAYATMSVSVRLSVTEVHWRIIANLRFQFRSKFIAHCGRGACGREGRDHRREEWRDHLALC